MGLRKISTKICDQLHIFFALETNLSFWWDLENFSQKSVPSYTFLRCGDYLKFLMGLWKFRQKDVTSYTFFFRSADYLKFLTGLGKFRQKGVTSYTFFALETILSVWGDLESFDKKIWPVTQFLECRLSLVFDGTLKVSAKRCDQLHIFFAVQTILNFWWDLESFDKKVWPFTRFFSLWRLS